MASARGAKEDTELLDAAADISNSGAVPLRSELSCSGQAGEEAAGCCASIGVCISRSCQFLANLPVLPTFLLIVSIISGSVAASGDHDVEDKLRDYGLNAKWLTRWIYFYISAVTILNVLLVVLAQYTSAHDFLKHFNQHQHPEEQGACFRCLDKLGSTVLILAFVGFSISYVVCLGLTVLGVFTSIVAIVVEVFHLLCTKTNSIVVWAALQGLEALPVGLDFKLESQEDVDHFCDAIDSVNTKGRRAAIYTMIFAASQITMAICAWNTIKRLQFRNYVQNNSGNDDRSLSQKSII